MGYDESDAWEEMAMDSLYSDFRQDPDRHASMLGRRTARRQTPRRIWLCAR